jgi:DNA-binding PadR family transcriptional regulator
VGRNRTGVLEFAVLGLLHRTPMHGYELSKQLNSILGAFRALSYGTLYPCLNKLFEEGLIAKEGDMPAAARGATAARIVAGPRSAAGTRGAAGARGAAGTRGGATKGKGRSKIVYRLTAEGKERLQDLLAESGPASWEDEEFGVHFAFFGQTRADIRLRILEGRRSRLEERVEGVRTVLARTAERVDSYTLELQRYGLESVEREVRWLNELIASERRSEVSSAGGANPPAGRTDSDPLSEKE